MKRKTKLLFGLLLFPIVYFFFIVILGQSAPSTVGIVSVSASANAHYRRSGRHGEAPQANSGSEHDVRSFIESGGRVVILMHQPKNRYFTIMSAYLIRNRRIPDGPFDPTRLVDEVRVTTFPDADRLDYFSINQLAGSLEGYVVIDTATLMQRGCDAFSTYDNQKTIYVKVDASIVYLHEFTVFNLVQAVLAGGEKGGIIAVANVINNQKLSGLHAALGAHDQTDGFEAIKAEEATRLEELHLDRSLQEEILSPPFDFYDKHTQISGAHAYLQHLYFFHHKKNSELQSKYFFESIDARILGYSGWILQVFAFSGADMKKVFKSSECLASVPAQAITRTNGIVSNALYTYLMEDISMRDGRAARVIGNALAVSFANHVQLMPFKTSAPFSPNHDPRENRMFWNGDDIYSRDPLYDYPTELLAEIIKSDFPFEDTEEEQEFQDRKRMLANSRIMDGGRYGFSCSGSSGWEVLEKPRVGDFEKEPFSDFGCLGWLEDKVLPKFEEYSVEVKLEMIINSPGFES